ncbi:uncharacterized protein LOC129575111 [Sitodiplosis mosellana]|uniref:uncharacterized protein LOC129575111 n=1 Tax=Sitodiplosis mosellana TaxID=263140 RepID=UPI002444047D|nr:uncharacterized protein LOC129575111 [Sitodiplosis mosellana]
MENMPQVNQETQTQVSGRKANMYLQLLADFKEEKREVLDMLEDSDEDDEDLDEVSMDRLKEINNRIVSLFSAYVSSAPQNDHAQISDLYLGLLAGFKKERSIIFGMVTEWELDGDQLEVYIDRLNEIDSKIVSLVNAYESLAPQNDDQNVDMYSRLLAGFKKEKLRILELIKGWQYEDVLQLWKNRLTQIDNSIFAMLDKM